MIDCIKQPSGHNTVRGRLLVALIAAAGLGACGGGDDDPVSGPSAGATATRVTSCGGEGGALRIMPLGDSITEAKSGYDSYRRPLWQSLAAAGCSVDFVGSKTGVSQGSRDSGSTAPPNPDFDQDHEAYWDYQTNEVQALASAKVAAAQPDIVLIHLGTNDVLDGQSAVAVAAEIGGVIDAIRASKADTYIVLAKVIPAARNPAATAALNQQIDAIAASRNQGNSPVQVVNPAAGYSLSNNYDGVHPNPAGEAKIAAQFGAAILAWSAM